MACMDHVQCKSYNFQETENVPKLCELSSSTEAASSADFVSRQGYSYSDAEVEPDCNCVNGGTCTLTSAGAVCQCLDNIYYPDYQGLYCEYPYPASCKEVKESGQSNGDGEYDLYLLHPVCLRTSRVYCADMSTDNPLEYVSLPAGRGNNYAFDNRPPGHTYRDRHSKTAYDKIRLDVPSLEVDITDSRFSVQIVGINIRPYGSAHDCKYHSSCSGYQTYKAGIAVADLTGTDFKFPSSIPYNIGSWPSCAKVLVDPTMSADRKKWSVKCGGHCGGCSPKPLILHIDGC